MNPIVVTASTMMEVSQLVGAVAAVPLTGVGHLPVFGGEIDGREIIVALTGLGKVNAASATTLLLERFQPLLLINTGCGGAYAGSGLAVGDLAVASSETFADEGVATSQGWRGLELIGIPLFEGRGEQVFNTLPLAAEVAAAACRRAEAAGFTAKLGPFLTVSTCSGTAACGAELLRRFPGICENMEGAAVAQVALMYGVPLLEVRGISNLVEDRDLSRWNLKLAVKNVQNFLHDWLRHTSISGFQY